MDLIETSWTGWSESVRARLQLGADWHGISDAVAYGAALLDGIEGRSSGGLCVWLG